MDFTFSNEDQAFRNEVREWLKKEIPPEWSESYHKIFEDNDEIWKITRRFERKLAEKGWYAPSYPPQYGGIGASVMQQCILAEEKAALGAPMIMSQLISAEYVGSTIMRYGSEEQKESYVGGIGRADLVFSLGYSEPQAGSDLASLQTRAVEQDDHFVINGQKTFNSLGHRADYVWLAARTDPDLPKHKGISMFIVDTKTPGITIRPLINICGYHHFDEVFFDDVRVPKTALVGEKNRGWYYLMTALNYERSGIALPAALRQRVYDLIAYTRETPTNGGVLADDPLVRQKLAEMATEVEVALLLAYRVVDLESRGLIPAYEVSESIMFGFELSRHIAKLGGEILGLYGQLTRDSTWVPLRGAMEDLYVATLVAGIGGGSSEIQKNIIALLGLGLPRSGVAY